MSTELSGLDGVTRQEVLERLLQAGPRGLQTDQLQEALAAEWDKAAVEKALVELQRDDEGSLWVMVHSGSRAMGQAIRDHHLRGAQTAKSGLRYLDDESDAGKAYVEDLQWGLCYAEENRRALVAAACALGNRRCWDTWLFEALLAVKSAPIARPE